MTTPVYFRGAKREAVLIVERLVASLYGDGQRQQNADLARGVHNSVGLAALADVHGDFIVKARGGTGADGSRWEPLKPATLAYGRRAPRGRGFAPGGKDGLLTRAQLQRWRNLYSGRLRRYAVSMDIGEAKSRAAAEAWVQIKREGGRTKIAEYANRPHEIGRDTGVMLNSLAPGELAPGGNYSKPDENQKFENLANGVIVGTTVPYAKHFAKRRPIFPDPIPQSWIRSWARIANRATLHAIRIALQRGTL